MDGSEVSLRAGSPARRSRRPAARPGAGSARVAPDGRAAPASPYQGAGVPTSRASTRSCGSIRPSASSAARPRLTTQGGSSRSISARRWLGAVASSPERGRSLRPSALARIAEHGVGDEDAAPLDACARQERVEVAAGLVAAQRDARPVRAEPPRRLGHEQHPSRRAARCPARAPGSGPPSSGTAGTPAPPPPAPGSASAVHVLPLSLARGEGAWGVRGEGSSRSHPEDPERRRRDRGVQRRRDAQPQHRPRVDRIDDAVVPEARRAEVRAALVLVPLDRSAP